MPRGSVKSGVISRVSRFWGVIFIAYRFFFKLIITSMQGYREYLRGLLDSSYEILIHHEILEILV